MCIRDRYGVDLDERRLPQEADRDELAISFTKGCYLGQETVARIDALGRVNWKLVTLKVGDGSLTPQDLPSPETKLNTAEEEYSVGHVTSAVWSPKHSAPVAFALVRRESLEKSAELKIGAHAASVIA